MKLKIQTYENQNKRKQSGIMLTVSGIILIVSDTGFVLDEKKRFSLFKKSSNLIITPTRKIYLFTLVSRYQRPD